MVKAHIGIRQSNIKGLQDVLLDISDPESSNYGRWLTRAQIDEYSRPAASDVVAVKAWLNTAGIVQVSQPSNEFVFYAKSIG